MKTRNYQCSICSIAAWLFVTLWCDAQELKVAPDHASGVYGVGDSVTWTAIWHGGDEVPPVHYVLKSGGLKEIDQGDLTFHDGSAVLHSTFVAPNTLLLELTWRQDGKQQRSHAGAVAAPKEIRAAESAPGDFDSFWQSKLDELAKIPPNPRL